ncbi:MAG: DUF2442 domain-containing protein [Desulfamplus sp.]|nr:DUF2442 domain-containing protein [Desulfamplus sp.]
MHVKTARYFNDYKIEVSFNNGRKGVAYLSEVLSGIFQPLKDKFKIKQMRKAKALTKK